MGRRDRIKAAIALAKPPYWRRWAKDVNAALDQSGWTTTTSTTSTTTTTTTVTTTTTAAPWIPHFGSPTEWTGAGVPAPGVSWDGSKFSVVSAGPGSIYQLVSNGSMTGLTPVAIRITFNLTAGTVDFAVKGIFSGVWGSQAGNSPNVAEFPISRDGRLDIYYIDMGGVNVGATLEITNIEFQY